MLRRIVLAILFLLMLTGVASAATTLPVTVLLDNQKITFDVQPQIIDGRTMVPLKGIFDALQISVNWDQKTQTVTGTKEDTVIKLTINNSTAYVNGKAVKIDTPALIKNGRTLVPLRFIAEATESRVTWNGTTRQAGIYFNTLAPQDGTTTSNLHNELNLIERDGYTYEGRYDGGRYDGIIKYKNGVYVKHIMFGSSLYLNVTSQFIFYSNPNDKFKIYRINIDGTNKMAFKDSEDSSDLTVRDGYIYYIHRGENYSIYRMKTDGTEIKKLNNGVAETINVTDNHIYYFDDFGYSASIYRINKDGTNKVCLYKTSRIDNMLVTNGGIYFSNNEGLSVINLDGKGYKLITKDVCNYFNFKGNKLYYASYSDNNNIYSITANKNIRSKLNSENSTKLTILGDNIYYNTKDQNNIISTKSIKIENPPLDIIPVSGNQQGKYLGTTVLNSELNYSVKDSSGQNTTYSFNWEQTDWFNRDAVVLGDWVYYISERSVPGSDYLRYIYRKRLDGTGSRMVTSHKKTHKFTVVGDWIYYLTDDAFWKVKTDGTQEKFVKSIDTNITPFDYFGSSFIVEGDWIYYQYHSAQADTTTIYKMKTDGSQSAKFIDQEIENFLGSASDALYASQYYMNSETNRYERKVVSISLTDKKVKVIGSGSLIPRFNINSIPEGKLYMVKYNIEKNLNELYYSQLDGSNETYVLNLPETTNYENLNLIDNYFYYQDNNNKYQRIIIN